MLLYLTIIRKEVRQGTEIAFFGKAQGRPFVNAQDRPFVNAQGRPFVKAAPLSFDSGLRLRSALRSGRSTTILAATLPRPGRPTTILTATLPRSGGLQNPPPRVERRLRSCRSRNAWKREMSPLIRQDVRLRASTALSPPPRPLCPRCSASDSLHSPRAERGLTFSSLSQRQAFHRGEGQTLVTPCRARYNLDAPLWGDGFAFNPLGRGALCRFIPIVAKPVVWYSTNI